MKIAVIAPSHVPFMIGGAERLWFGLTEQLNAVNDIACEIIKLPSPEHSFWAIIDSYQLYYNLDLSHFDLIISGKNPSWMVRHPNHIVYMLHPLRGLYDTYQLFNLPNDVASRSFRIRQIAAACDSGISTDDLFSELAELRLLNQEDPQQFQLPSPFLRKIVHRLDANALRHASGLYAISQTVASRDDYFHGADNIGVLYPPITRDFTSEPPSNYFLVYSRLDEAKRIDLIISAFRNVKTRHELLIVGDGPCRVALEALAEKDPRIRFLGRVPDSELSLLVGRSFASIFSPYQEDYGYVAIESLAAGKPVITTTDSGGPLEFVREGINGFLAEPNPTDLAAAITRCINFPKYASLEREAKAAVASITWPKLINGLLSSMRMADNSRPTLISLSTYPIYPPRGGGQNRVFYCNKYLSEDFNVTVICLVDAAKTAREITLSASFRIIEVPASREFAEKDWFYYQKTGVPTTDIVFSAFSGMNSAYITRAQSLLASCDVAVAEQPYTFGIVKQFAPPCVLRVLNSQNSEVDLKEQMFTASESQDDANFLIERTHECEESAHNGADVIIYCSEDDRTVSERRFAGAANARNAVIANGTEIGTVRYFGEIDHNASRIPEFRDATVCAFIGSWHEPNIKAVSDLFSLFADDRGVIIIIAGTVCNYFSDKNHPIPANFALLGVIDDQQKNALLACADVALNPMTIGSGTNIKMFDYMASGIPVLTTPVGARGIDTSTAGVTVCELSAFPTHLKFALDSGRSHNRRRHVEDNFTWRRVCKPYSDVLIKELASKYRPPSTSRLNAGNTRDQEHFENQK